MPVSVVAVSPVYRYRTPATRSSPPAVVHPSVDSTLNVVSAGRTASQLSPATAPAAPGKAATSTAAAVPEAPDRITASAPARAPLRMRMTSPGTTAAANAPALRETPVAPS